jgi:hypothetical protein
MDNNHNELLNINPEYEPFKLNSIVLNDKFNLNFHLLCLLYESLSKAKAKSKVK